jgi:hypothetical protein
MYCKSCGNKNSEGNFCIKCGEKKEVIKDTVSKISPETASKRSPETVAFLNIFSFGIYGYYWFFKHAKKVWKNNSKIDLIFKSILNVVYLPELLESTLPKTIENRSDFIKTSVFWFRVAFAAQVAFFFLGVSSNLALVVILPEVVLARVLMNIQDKYNQQDISQIEKISYTEYFITFLGFILLLKIVI